MNKSIGIEKDSQQKEAYLDSDIVLAIDNKHINGREFVSLLGVTLLNDGSHCILIAKGTNENKLWLVKRGAQIIGTA